jgi:hypothetical protein
MTIEKNFLFPVTSLASTLQIQIWFPEGPVASFSLFAALHIGLFHSVYV